MPAAERSERVLDCTDPATRAESITKATEVVSAGKVVVFPTDTVYGIGADAFDVVAVAMVLAAKHRTREMPPPVLVPDSRTVEGLAMDIPMYAKILMRHFWPGPLTIVLRAQPSLHWDLGETNGTVALRMPDDEIALELLKRTGPMAVTSANVTGQPPASTAQEALEQFGGAVTIYLDGGSRHSALASTIVDCTGDEAVILRPGALSADTLREVLGQTVLHESVEAYAAAREQRARSEGLAEVGGADRPGTSADAEEEAQSSDTGGALVEADLQPADTDNSRSPVDREGHARQVGSVQPSGVHLTTNDVRFIPPPQA